MEISANEAIEIEFFKEVTNKKIKKGRYTLYTIPFPDKWTLIVNMKTDTWGSFNYDSSKDVVRIDLPLIKNDPTEDMSIVFEKAPSGTTMNI